MQFFTRAARMAGERDRLAPQPHQGSGLWGPATTDLSVVLPFYNPGAALRRTVLALIDCLTAAAVDFELIAVSDGSTDGSPKTIADIEQARVLFNPVNKGKGAALRRGFAAAGGRWIGFVDADGDINPRHLVDYLRHAQQAKKAGVYADKRHTNSCSAATALRKAMSLAYSTLVTALFGLDVHDTQTGCKIFRRDVLAALLPHLSECRFALDLELFVAAKLAGITDFMPAPVELGCRENGSTINCKAILRTVGDTVGVYCRYHLGQWHRPD